MSRDPFKITSPTCISFSGGRTSAYMLWRVLQSNGGLPDECVVCFANTGKEEEETLQFVRDCAQRWGVPITWLEYRAPASYALVDFDSAARNGAPFDALIKHKGMYLPNPMQRFCTVDLKIMPMYRRLAETGMLETGSVDVFVGVRADEPHRVAKQSSAGRRKETPELESVLPLAVAGIGKHEVLKFWAAQPFDLHTDNSNCDLCFEKPPARRRSLIAQRPGRAVWWIAKESEVGATFTKDGHTYAGLAQSAAAQMDFIGHDNEEAIACFCGD
jgi:3'-phosphoadenosine 5'-phosphosulfate sulfotransferase (PAPS reductase)/FAD synthetase